MESQPLPDPTLHLESIGPDQSCTRYLVIVKSQASGLFHFVALIVDFVYLERETPQGLVPLPRLNRVDDPANWQSIFLGTYDSTEWVFTFLNPGESTTIYATILTQLANLDWRYFGRGQTTLTVTAPSEPPTGCPYRLRKPPLSVADPGDGQRGLVGTTLPMPFIVQVVDKDLQPAPGINIEWRVTGKPSGATGQSVTPTGGSTDTQGLARATLTLGDKVGTYTVSASCLSCASGSPQTFTALATLVRILVKPEDPEVSGDGQEGPVRSTLPLPMVVTVTDEDGNAVSGVDITWAITGPDGATGQAVTPTSSTTGSDGRASTTVTVGDKPGDYTITATCLMCTSGSPVTFTATAVGCSGLTVRVYNTPRPIGTEGDPTATVTAEVSEPAPPGGCAVEFEEPEAMAGSGGHAHHEPPPRPHGTLDPMQCTIPEGMTFCFVTYVSSEVAGEENLKATLTDTGETAEATVRVMVPGLSPLPTSDKYLLAGRFGEPGVISRHTDNHNGTTSTVILLQSLAADYFGETGARLCINDISLPLGGLFDIENSWTPPHKFHRVGRSVDINTHAECFSIEPPLLDLEKLEKAAARWGATRFPEGGLIHYEFP